jgi:hypothetical protein
MTERPTGSPLPRRRTHFALGSWSAGGRRRLAGAQDHHHRLAALGVIDVDGQEPALVVVGIPERALLAAVHAIKRVIVVRA